MLENYLFRVHNCLELFFADKKLGSVEQNVSVPLSFFLVHISIKITTDQRNLIARVDAF